MPEFRVSKIALDLTVFAFFLFPLIFQNCRASEDLRSKPVPIISRPTPVPVAEQIIVPKPRDASQQQQQQAAPPVPWRRPRAIPTPIPTAEHAKLQQEYLQKLQNGNASYNTRNDGRYIFICFARLFFFSHQNPASAHQFAPFCNIHVYQRIARFFTYFKNLDFILNHI